MEPSRIDLTCQLRSKLLSMTESPITLVLNKNRCTYVKVLFQKPIFVSAHEAFLYAPDQIIRSLASYINGNVVEEERLFKYMQGYYQTHDQKKLRELCPKGTTYDLSILYDKMNKTFFESRLELSTTWWKTSPKPGAHQCTLGVFLDSLQLIKITDLLDSPSVPQYVVESVLFHEMAHAVVPTEKDIKGRTLVHTKTFRQQMQAYPHTKHADEWLKNNRSHFFKKK